MANEKVVKSKRPMVKLVKKNLQDLFIVVNSSKINEKHQFSKAYSDIYKCDEFVWKGNLTHGATIKFCHADGRLLPNIEVYNNISGPGITLSGKQACLEFKVEDALVCPVDDYDLIYNFMSDKSKLTYLGETKERTIYIRIYDNNLGNDNDRWLVISIE